MGWFNLETTRGFQYLILLATLVAGTTGSPPTTITYVCGKSGLESIQESDFGHFAVVSGGPTNQKYCKPTSAKFLDNCTDAKGEKTIILIYEDVNTKTLIGGKTPSYYKLNCQDAATNVTHKTVEFTAKPELSKATEFNHTLTHDFKLQLKNGDVVLTGNPIVEIGQPLAIHMTGEDVIISPEVCYAYPKGKRSDKITIWQFINNDNNKECKISDPAIIGSDKWSQKKAGDIEIELYAFRFIEKNEVVIECSAFVCSLTNPTECLQICVDDTGLLPTEKTSISPNTTKKTTVTPDPQVVQGGRKRRGIVTKDDSRRIRSSSVSFSVRTKEGLINSSPGVSAGNIKFVTVGLALLFVILPKH